MVNWSKLLFNVKKKKNSIELKVQIAPKLGIICHTPTRSGTIDANDFNTKLTFVVGLKFNSRSKSQTFTKIVTKTKDTHNHLNQQRIGVLNDFAS